MERKLKFLTLVHSSDLVVVAPPSIEAQALLNRGLMRTASCLPLVQAVAWLANMNSDSRAEAIEASGLTPEEYDNYLPLAKDTLYAVDLGSTAVEPE